MDKARWKKIRELFEHLSEQSPSFRDNYLNMVCGQDTELRTQVDAMLKAHDDMHAIDAIAQIPVNRHTPSVIGNYTIVSELGRGGMGVVYRARHPDYGTVALKVLPVGSLRDQRASRRFAQEASLLAKLDHPIVTRIYEAGVADANAFIAMDEINGSTLAQELSRQRIPLSAAVDITLKLADGLARAHQAGVVHRDIKPSNVLLCEHRRPHLIDFGIAKFADTRLTATGELLGSPAYMSPEQWRGAGVDARTDVWSLGVLLFEMLSGDTPFQGSSVGEMAKSVLAGKVPRLPSKSIDGHSLHNIETVLVRMLQEDQRKRLANMAVVLRQLGAITMPP